MRIPNPDEPPVEVPLEVMFSTANVEDDCEEIAQRFLKTNVLPNPWLRPPNPREQQQSEDDGELSKKLGLNHRKLGLLEFLKRRLAMGETVESVIAFAGEHDFETAALLREVAAEAGLA